MAHTSDRTGADIDQVLDDADAGNIGNSQPDTTPDADDERAFGVKKIDSTTPNGNGKNGALLTLPRNNTNSVQMIGNGWNDVSAISLSLRGVAGGSYSDWAEIYHTGNTGVVQFDGNATPNGSVDIVQLGLNGSGRCDIARTGTTASTVLGFSNSNGLAGSITTSGTATAYNTSSDPRLKDFKVAPSDEAIDDKFSDLFDAFAVFNWKSDPDGDLVWGFDAHKAIDNGLDLGSEGEGSRDLELGEVYDTIPAELDEEGNEIKPSQELKVSPAGVDQSKAVPILLAKLEQLERRVKELEA